MDNNHYSIKVVSIADRIYMDTSTLMEPMTQRFIRFIRPTLLEEGKKIIIKHSVYTELARHLNSPYKHKVECALKAIELLAVNDDLFQVESSPLTDEDISNAFADPELLAELTIHKNCNSQLLIVNDKNLSCDAYKLNKQESCKGGWIFVCYINDLGELHCCECARTEAKPMSVKKATVTPVTPVQSVPVADVTSAISALPVNKSYTNPAYSVVKREPEPWRFDWKSFGLGMAGSAGIGVLGYGAYRVFKTFARKNFLLEVVR